MCFSPFSLYLNSNLLAHAEGEKNVLATEKAGLEREKRVLSDQLVTERAGWERERALWERERDGWERERAGWEREREGLREGLEREREVLDRERRVVIDGMVAERAGWQREREGLVRERDGRTERVAGLIGVHVARRAFAVD